MATRLEVIRIAERKIQNYLAEIAKVPVRLVEPFNIVAGEALEQKIRRRMGRELALQHIASCKVEYGCYICSGTVGNFNGDIDMHTYRLLEVLRPTLAELNLMGD